MTSPKKNRLFYGLIFAALCFGGFLRLRDSDFDKKDTTIRTPDEAIYTAYASVVAHEGVRGTQISVGEFNKNPKLWILPPPTRIGYLYLLAAVMKGTGRDDLDLGIDVSRAVSVLSLILLAALCLRFFSPWAALCACLLMSASPMELAFARKVWQDGLMTLMGGVLIFLSLGVLRRKNKLLLLLIFGLAGAYTMLVKESGVIIFGLCAAWLAGNFAAQRLWKDFFRTAVVGMSATVLSLLVVVGHSGGWGPFLELYRHLSENIAGNTYAAQLQNGPWYSNLLGFFLLSPAVSVLCAAGILGAFRRGHGKDDETMIFLGSIFLAFLAAASLPQYFKNLRYLSPVYIAFYALAACAFASAMHRLEERLRNPAATGALAVLALGIMVGFDWVNFDVAFTHGHTKDLVNPLLAERTIYRFRRPPAEALK